MCTSFGEECNAMDLIHCFALGFLLVLLAHHFLGVQDFGFEIFYIFEFDFPRFCIQYTYYLLRPPQGVCEAHLHQAYRPYVIGAIQLQT